MLTAVAVLMVLLALLGGLSGHRTSSQLKAPAKRNRRFSPDLTVIQMVEHVNNRNDFAALLREIKKVERRVERATEKTYDKLVAYSNKLEEVESLTSNKTFARQLIVAENLNVPSEVLAHAYKVYDLDDFTIDAKALKREGLSWWSELDAYSDPEEEPESLSALKAFRVIVEGQFSILEKVEAINKLHTEMKPLFSGILEPREPLSAGQEWVACDLAAKGLPNARELVAEGILSPKDALTIDPDEFQKRKGVGPARLKQFLDFQRSVRES